MMNLYCSDQAKSVILSAGLTGAEFHEVLKEKTGEPVPDLWQLRPTECEDCLSPGPFMQTRKCRCCGKTRYYTSGGRAQLRIREDLVPKGLDFLQVPGAVGAEIGYPFNIISRYSEVR